MTTSEYISRFGRQPFAAIEAVVTSNCWSCGNPQYKRVRSRHHADGPFAWTCRDCEVDWVGPGEVISDLPKAG